MDTVIGIIVILVAIAFWRRILTGIVGGLIFGFIGSFFGGNGAKIGFVIGFIIGLTAKEDSEKKQDEENKDEKDTPKPDTVKPSGAPESKIIRCPSCKKKIRVRLPLQGKKGKCVACSSSFLISMDEHGNLKVDKETHDNASKPNYGSPTTDDYFKVLGIDPTSTPEEVRAALVFRGHHIYL